MQKIEQYLELKKLYLERMCGTTFMPLKTLKHANTASSNMGNANSFADLSANIQQCQLCLLCNTKAKPNAGYGNSHAKIAFITQTPLTTTSNATTLVARGGEMLQDMIEHVLCLSLKEVSLLSLLKCTPQIGQEVTQELVNSCSPYLFEQLFILKPKIIVTLGEEVTQVFLRINENFEEIRGKVSLWEHTKLIPLYSPRFLLKNPSLKKETMKDLIFIKSLL